MDINNYKKKKIKYCKKLFKQLLHDSSNPSEIYMSFLVLHKALDIFMDINKGSYNGIMLLGRNDNMYIFAKPNSSSLYYRLSDILNDSWSDTFVYRGVSDIAIMERYLAKNIGIINKYLYFPGNIQDSEICKIGLVIKDDKEYIENNFRIKHYLSKTASLNYDDFRSLELACDSLLEKMEISANISKPASCGTKKIKI